MEEILASIRRIISDEDTPEAETAEEEAEDGGAEMDQNDLDALFDSPAPAEPEPEPENPEKEMDQNDLDALFDAPAPAEEPEPEPEPDPEPSEPVIVEGLDPDDADISFAEEEEEDEEDIPLDLGPEFEVSEPEPEPEPLPAIEVNIDAPIDSAAQMAEALLSPTTDAVVSSAFGNLAHTILSKNARTLEDLVQEMLRPMLKGWLDDNLPTIVERLVRQEIERVTRNGGK